MGLVVVGLVVIIDFGGNFFRLDRDIVGKVVVSVWMVGWILLDILLIKL